MQNFIPEKSNRLDPEHPLSLQGEGQGGGLSKRQYEAKGGVTRNAAPKTKMHAKSLRKNLTEAEKRLWYHLRAKRFSEFKFRRQHPVANYIVDFICLREKLVIELDGGQHGAQMVYDQKRSRQLASQGFRVLRFWNNDVMNNMEGVLHVISQALSPALSLKGEGEDRPCACCTDPAFAAHIQPFPPPSGGGSGRGSLEWRKGLKNERPA